MSIDLMFCRHLCFCHVIGQQSSATPWPLPGDSSPWLLLTSPWLSITLTMGKRKAVTSHKDTHDGVNDDNLPRSAANARERTRMRVLSKSFERLKLMLPWVPADTKLSKLDTLRLAMTYINHLNGMLVESDNEQSTKDSKGTKGKHRQSTP